MIPREYPNQSIVSQETHYSTTPDAHSGPHARSGTLDVGRVVWTRSPLTEIKEEERIPAWVQGVGEIEIDPTCLKPF